MIVQNLEIKLQNEVKDQEDATGKLSASAYIDTLPFELVDIHKDYGYFKDVITFESPSKQN